MDDLDRVILSYCAHGTTHLARCVDRLEVTYFEDIGREIFRAMRGYYKKFHKCITTRALEHWLEKEDVDVGVVVECGEAFREICEQEPEGDFEYFLKEMMDRSVSLRFNSLIDGDGIDSKGNPLPALKDMIDEDPFEAWKLLRKHIGFHIEDCQEEDHIVRADVSEELQRAWIKYKEVKKHPGISYGVRTGFTILDEETQGMHPGELFIIAGAAGGGKSIFLLNAGINAYKAGKSVLLFSLEMSIELYRERFIACYCNVPVSLLKTGRLNGDQEKLVKKAVEAGSSKTEQLMLIDCPHASAMTIESELNRAIESCRNKPDLIIVDYLGIMRSTDPARSDWEEQMRAVEDLRKVARVYNIPILTAVQLNRDKKKTKSIDRMSRPALPHLVCQEIHPYFLVSCWQNSSTIQK